jgi:hypothetical protein
MGGDVIGLLDEDGPLGGEPLLAPVMKRGRRVISGSVDEAAGHFATEFRLLPPTLRSLHPGRYVVERSPALEKLAEEVRASITEREFG